MAIAGDGSRSGLMAAVGLAFLLLFGILVRGGGGASIARAQATGGPVAATPVALPAAPKAPVVTLVVERADAAFGVVSGAGEVDPAATGVESVVDATGASYVKRGAIRVVVTSGGPWTGTCHAGENSGSAATIRVGDGRLQWRLAGAEAWSAFGTSSDDPAAGACFPDPSPGVTSYTYDLRLRVERGDPPGTFAAVISFAVAPAGSV